MKMPAYFVFRVSGATTTSAVYQLVTKFKDNVYLVWRNLMTLFFLIIIWGRSLSFTTLSKGCIGSHTTCHCLLLAAPAGFCLAARAIHTYQVHTYGTPTNNEPFDSNLIIMTMHIIFIIGTDLLQHSTVHSARQGVGRTPLHLAI